MFESIVAFDVGTSSIKIIVAKTGLKDFQIKTLKHQSITFDPESDYADVKDTAVLQSMIALEKIINEEKLADLKIITNFPLENTILRNITFPFAEDDKIKAAIPFEAEEHIPFNIEDVVYDFQTLKRKEQQKEILLAVAHREKLKNFIDRLNFCDIKPLNMGLESNSLVECYNQVYPQTTENAIQIHIGHSKTIINFLEKKSLIFTRSVNLGLNSIYKKIAEKKKTNYFQTIETFEKLNLELSSLNANLEKNNYKNLNLTQQSLKNIYNQTQLFFKELLEEISLTIKSFQDLIVKEKKVFHKIILSGGAANLIGIEDLFSQEFEIPCEPLAILENYHDKKIQSQFPIAYGAVLSYLFQKKPRINFLKGEFKADLISSSRKNYFLASFFIILAMIMMLVNISSSSILTSKTDEEYQKIISEKFSSYFRSAQKTETPIVAAKKILNNEKKELKSIKLLLPKDESTLDLIQKIITHFPKDDDFVMRDMTVNKRIITINGYVQSSEKIDAFKTNLLKSQQFDSVSLNTRFYSRKNRTRFTMTIKQKLPEKEKKESLKEENKK